MALKKSQIYSSLWQSCDQLRGGMDASQYKDYVLTLLFMKYVSDKNAGIPDAMIDIPAGGGFADMARLKGDKEIGDKINKIIGRLAEANDLKGVIDQADFNDESKLGRGKEMQDRLSKLVAIFENLDFRANRTDGDDLLGDAYEYLMRHFATESGKSKGQFYTPAEVSRVMAQVVGIGPATRQDQTIYDPTCGSGSLLLKAADEAPRGMSIYGQEMDNATWALARMNLILHGHPTAELRRGNTLADPHFETDFGRLKTFDFAVSNPPFSTKAWSSGLDLVRDKYGRFTYGIPPDKNGDYAFLLHFIASLNSKGKGAIILPHGVLFRSNREADIRKSIVQRGLIKGIIGLPSNLFYGTGIPACILVIDKQDAHSRAGIFMIDASNGFLKDGNKNRLRSQDICKIVDVFNDQRELPRYSRMVPLAEIASPANHDFDLNITRYIDSSQPEDLHDLGGHMHGGIPDRDLDSLDDFWTIFPSLRDALFRANGHKGFSKPLVDSSQIETVVLNHEEFEAFESFVKKLLEDWFERYKQRLRAIASDCRPKKIIDELSRSLLTCISDLALIDAYDVYQRLLDYWDETMQDDVYLIAAVGWAEAAQPRGIVENDQKGIKELPDLTVKRNKYKMDLISPLLLVEHFFATDQSTIETLMIRQDASVRELEEFVEEHSRDGGPLKNLVNDSGKIAKSGVNALFKTLKEGPESLEVRTVLTRTLRLIRVESKAREAVNAAHDELNRKVLLRYASLTVDEIKTLVVECKWFVAIQDAVMRETQRLTQHLAGRVQELEERYAQPLPELEEETTQLEVKVKGHLKELGVVWK